MLQTIYQYLLSMSGIIALMGTYLIILGYTRNGFYDHVRQKGKKTEGIVVRLLEKEDGFHGSLGNKPQAPVVEFSTIHGHYKHVSTTYQNPTPYQVGQKVEIWYYFYKSRREMALIDDVPGEMPEKFFKWGIILCGLGYPMVFLKLKNFF